MRTNDSISRRQFLSLVGGIAAVCGLAVTTCAGYKHFRTESCTGPDNDAACGDSRFAQDGYCELFSTDTYRCTTP